MNEYLTEEFAENEETVITDDLMAEHCLIKERQAKEETRRRLELCKARLEELTALKESLERDLDAPTFWGLKVIAYMESKPEEELHKTKTQTSYKLLSGKVIKKNGGLTAVRNNAELLAWAKTSAPEFVKTKTVEDVDWAGLKKVTELTPEGAVYKETGEFVDGIQTEMKADKYEFKFEEEAR